MLEVTQTKVIQKYFLHGILMANEFSNIFPPIVRFAYICFDVFPIYEFARKLFNEMVLTAMSEM